MGVVFRGNNNTSITVTLAVASKTGGPVKATFTWQSLKDPKNPVIIKDDQVAAPSSFVIRIAADLAAAPNNRDDMLANLLPTDDALVWAWATQNDVPLPAYDDLGNQVPGQGPHQAVQAAAATKGQTAHIPVGLRLS